MTARHMLNYAVAAFGAVGTVVVGSHGGVSLWFAAALNAVVWVMGQALCHSTDDLTASVKALLVDLKRERGK